MGEILADAVRCYARHPALFALLALGVVVPYSLIVLLVNGSGPLGQSRLTASTALILILLDLLLVTPLISALHIHALVDIGEGRQPELLEVARRGLRVLPVVAAAEVMAGLGTVVGFLLLFVPGVFLAIRWAVVAQAAAVGKVDWLSALKRSAELTSGDYLHVLGVIVIVSLISLVVQALGAAAVGSGAGVGQVLVGIVVQTITRSFAALSTAVLFYDLLARKGLMPAVGRP